MSNKVTPKANETNLGNDCFSSSNLLLNTSRADESWLLWENMGIKPGFLR